MAKCDHGKFRGNCSLCSPEKVYRRYQRQAQERNLAFSLSLSDFETLVHQACVFCGEQPAGGVDRRSNALGYSPENVQASCTLCNRFKSNLDQWTFLAHAQKITRYQEALQRQQAEQAQSEVRPPAQSEPKRSNPKPEPEPFRGHLPPDARRFLDEGWDPRKNL